MHQFPDFCFVSFAFFNVIWPLGVQLALLMLCYKALSGLCHIVIHSSSISMAFRFDIQWFLFLGS